MEHEKQRATYHNGRKGDNGKPIKATHNEHDFEAEHIDKTKTADNRRWLFQEVKVKEGKGFQDRYEQAVYEQYFTPYLERRNAKAIKGRRRDRVQTMEQFRVNQKACPEESIIGIGNMKNQVDPDVLADVYEAYVQWHRQTFPNVLLLSAYMHLDEANPHIQERKVWTAHEGDLLIINQEKALAEMGIERPDTSRKVGRNNNAKMTYTAMCRAKLIELARAQGLEIEDKPKDPSKSGMKLLRFKYEALKEDCEKLQTEITSQNRQIKEQAATIQGQSERIEALEQALTAAASDIKETKTVKGTFGKEKEVPKTAEELKHDQEIVGAKLVLQREAAVEKRETECDARERRLSEIITAARNDEKQMATERQRIAVARARAEEKRKAEQEQMRLQAEQDRAVAAQAALQSRLDQQRKHSDELDSIATDYADLVGDILQSYKHKEYAALHETYKLRLQHTKLCREQKAVRYMPTGR